MYLLPTESWLQWQVNAAGPEVFLCLDTVVQDQGKAQHHSDPLCSQIHTDPEKAGDGREIHYLFIYKQYR